MSSTPLTVLCGLDGPRVADTGAGLLLRGNRLALVHLDPADADRGTVECRVTDSDGRCTEQTFDLMHDCLSCTMRESTALVVRRLIATGRYDDILVRLHPGVEASIAVAGLDAELAGEARVDTVVLDLGADWLTQLADAVRTGTYDPAAQDVLTRRGLLSPTSRPPSGARDLTLVRWQATAPLHPMRLHAALEQLADGVIRSSGRLWFATNPELVIGWDSAGDRLALGAEAHWPQPLLRSGGRPRPDFSGRHNVIVFFGECLDEAHLRAALDGCVLTAQELRAGPDAWRRYADPFAEWGNDESRGVA